MKNITIFLLAMFFLICLGTFYGLITSKLAMARRECVREQRIIDQHLAGDTASMKEQKQLIDLLAHEYDSMIDVATTLRDSMVYYRNQLKKIKH